MKNDSYVRFPVPAVRITVIGIVGLMFLLVVLSGSRPVVAANPITIDWSDISPDISPNPDFVEDDTITPEVDTYFSAAADPHADPYHGLGSSTGGLSGFNSQTFTNVNNSTVDVTVYYSRNNYDDQTLEGPDLYQPEQDPNPDRRVTAEWVLRVNRDHIGSRTPTTVVLSFSEDVYMDEFIVGSLSNVIGAYEHAIVRAFATPDATGQVVKASGVINISNLATCATLLHNQCVADGPTPTNLLSNIAVDPDLTDINGDGDYENVGDGTDDGVYHVHGVINQPDGYGRAKWIYDTQAIRSIAVSFFATSSASSDPFTDTAYVAQWVSSDLAPYTFTPFDPTAISMRQISTATQGPGLVVIGLVLTLVVLTGGLLIRRQRNAEPSA